MLNIVNHQHDIDKTYLYDKDSFEVKYQLLDNKHQSVSSRHCNNPKTFTEYYNDMDDTYENINDYNPNKKRKILIVFGDMK